MFSNPAIQVEIVAHSTATTASPDDVITFLLTGPIFLDAELRTHRMASQNVESTRAVPFLKQLDKEPFYPTDVRLNEKGMQGYTHADPDQVQQLTDTLSLTYNRTAAALEPYGTLFHKQHLSRYLSPFLTQRRLFTCTGEYLQYFLGLRSAQDADPNIQDLANKMEAAYIASNPRFIIEKDRFQWHLPFIGKEELADENNSLEDLIRMSGARCSRISYNNLDGTKWEKTKDLKSAWDLINDIHMTPFEHQLEPMTKVWMRKHSNGDVDPFWFFKVDGVTAIGKDLRLKSGNAIGWVQARHTAHCRKS